MTFLKYAKQNWQLKLISLLLAVALWFYLFGKK